MTRASSLLPFRFKKFSVAMDKVPMKVGTDGVLLATWADIEGKMIALDVGTGSGVISLILAQRSSENAKIHAIDVDPNAIEQSEENFKNSPWPERFTLIHQSIQEYASQSEHKYDLIISNPPFFTGGLSVPESDRAYARHALKLPHGDLLLAVSRLLHPLGTFALILPYLQGLRFLEIAEMYGLFPSRISEVYTKPDKPIERLLIEFKKNKLDSNKSQLIIQDQIGNFTEAYKKLTGDFYLNF